MLIADVCVLTRAQLDNHVLDVFDLDEDEDRFSPMWRSPRHRVFWLGINLGTAFLASSVVGRFEATIQQLTALAVLMPIVAGMGGNAGTQEIGRASCRERVCQYV